MKNFTRIENDILEALIKSNLSSAELRIAICILRKLNGFNKDSDMISLSQFMEYTGLSNRGVINAQRQLILMNICSLVENYIPVWQQIGMGLVGFLLMWLMCFL